MKWVSTIILYFCILAACAKTPQENMPLQSQAPMEFLQGIELEAFGKANSLPREFQQRITDLYNFKNMIFDVSGKDPEDSRNAMRSGYKDGRPTVTVYIRTLQQEVATGIVRISHVPDFYVELLLLQSFLWDNPNSAFLLGERTEEAIADESLAMTRLASVADVLQENGIVITGFLRQNRRRLKNRCNGQIPCPVIIGANWLEWQSLLRQKR